jgi:hypothetical protein
MTVDMERRMLRAWTDLLACLRDLSPKERLDMLSLYQHLLRQYAHLSAKEHEDVPHTKSN